MELITKKQAIEGNNSKQCKTLEYSFKDKDIDVGVATITGRYPEIGYCMNLVSKELIYVLDGAGTLYLENESIKFEKGDAILIDAKEKYYWNSDFCVISMTCTPAWSKEQYKLIIE